MAQIPILRRMALKFDESGTMQPITTTKLYQGGYGFVMLQVYAPVTQNDDTGQGVQLTVSRTAINQSGLVNLYKSQKYSLMYVGKITHEGKEYSLFERPLPKSFTDDVGELRLNFTYNVVEITQEMIDDEIITNTRVLARLASGVYTQEVSEGDYTKDDIPAEELNDYVAQINANTASIDTIGNIILSWDEDKQDKYDGNLVTTNKTVVGAINELNGDIDDVYNDLTDHAEDADIHVTLTEKSAWNAKLGTSDVINNLTSDETNKPLSANQGQVLKGMIDTKTSLTLGTSSDTAYRGDRGNTAYLHSQSTGNPHDTTFSEINDKPTTVSGYGISDAYTKAEVDNKITAMYKYKGSVASFVNLPTTGNVIGDVWNVADTGKNYAWDGTAWDALGGDFDLSDYYTKTATNALLNDKVDKIAGKGLSTNDLTNTLKTQYDTAYTHSQATGNPHATTFAQLESKPTTISGYGITNAYNKTETDTMLSDKANNADIPVISSKAEAEEGANNTKMMTPLRVKEAINVQTGQGMSDGGWELIERFEFDETRTDTFDIPSDGTYKIVGIGAADGDGSQPPTVKITLANAYGDDVIMTLDDCSYAHFEVVSESGGSAFRSVLGAFYGQLETVPINLSSYTFDRVHLEITGTPSSGSYEISCNLYRLTNAKRVITFNNITQLDAATKTAGTLYFAPYNEV